MATEKQTRGEIGEKLVAKKCRCPKCKRSGTFKRLPANFKCADLICECCGFLAQGKAWAVNDITRPPDSVQGAAWHPQKERMDSAIYFPLYIVTISRDAKKHAIYYLSADLQEPEIFEPRTPLGAEARRAGWQGFNYRISHIRERVIRLV